MVDPIGGAHSSPLQPKQIQSSDNVSLLTKQMQSQVLHFAQFLQKILEEPSLTTQGHFLEEFSSNGQNLNRTIEQVNQLK